MRDQVSPRQVIEHFAAALEAYAEGANILDVQPDLWTFDDFVKKSVQAMLRRGQNVLVPQLEPERSDEFNQLKSEIELTHKTWRRWLAAQDMPMVVQYGERLIEQVNRLLAWEQALEQKLAQASPDVQKQVDLALNKLPFPKEMEFGAVPSIFH